MTLYPPKTGLNYPWIPGDIATGPMSRSFWHCEILEPVDARFGSCLVLTCSGTVCSVNVQELLTCEGFRKHCDYMRNDLTGREYDAAIQFYEQGCPFTPPQWWSEAVQNARQPR